MIQQQLRQVKISKMLVEFICMKPESLLQPDLRLLRRVQLIPASLLETNTGELTGNFQLQFCSILVANINFRCFCLSEGGACCTFIQVRGDRYSFRFLGSDIAAGNCIMHGTSQHALKSKLGPDLHHAIEFPSGIQLIAR